MNELLLHMKLLNETFVGCTIIFDRGYIENNPSNNFDVVSKFLSRVFMKKIRVYFHDHPDKYKCFGTIWKIMGSLRDKKVNIWITFKRDVMHYSDIDYVVYIYLSLKKSWNDEKKEGKW